jgi:hypothetical protein
MDSRLKMEGRVHSFPYNKHIWLITINQIADPNNSKVFFKDFSSVIDLTNYNFAGVTDLIIGTGVNELNTYGDHTNYLQETINNCEQLFPNLKHIYLFYTNVYFQDNLLTSEANLTCMHLPYFLLRSTLPNTSTLSEWDLGNKKAICLIGDIRNRVHKFPLLYYFHNNNKLDVVDYSLLNTHYGDNYFTEEHCALVIDAINGCFDKTYDLKTFENLYHSLSKTFSNDEGYINPMLTGLNRYTHNFPPVWNDATLNILLECTFYSLNNQIGRFVSNGQQEFFFSEKVWKPILSKKPFISLSEYDLIDTQLEEMGFRTFSKYTDFGEKVNIDISSGCDDFTEALHKYLEICYSRTLSFIDNCDLHRQEIKEDVIYNFQLWEKLGKESWEELYIKCPVAKKMTKQEFCEIFDHVPAFYMFKNWVEKE